MASSHPADKSQISFSQTEALFIRTSSSYRLTIGQSLRMKQDYRLLFIEPASDFEVRPAPNSQLHSTSFCSIVFPRSSSTSRYHRT